MIFPILGEPSATVEPREGSLDDPTFGNDDEALGAIRTLDDFRRRHDRNIWKLTLSTGSDDGKAIATVFETTDDHPWRTVAGAWVKTMGLKPGIQILRARGPPALVVSIKNTGKSQPTFNLEVADFHSYFAGEQQVWVLNCGAKNSPGKAALVDIAQQGKKTGGISKGDMQAYKDLNNELPDPFPEGGVRGPEKHSGTGPGSKEHGHVGPVKHIPIVPDPKNGKI